MMNDYYFSVVDKVKMERECILYLSELLKMVKTDYCQIKLLFYMIFLVYHLIIYSLMKLNVKSSLKYSYNKQNAML